MAHRFLTLALIAWAAAEGDQACLQDGMQSSCAPDTRPIEGVAMLQRAIGQHTSQVSTGSPEDEHEHGDHEHKHHRLIYFNWWQRSNGHNGLECVVADQGSDALRFASIGDDSKTCLKFMLNNGHNVPIATEDGRCLEVPKSPRQKVMLSPCDEDVPNQRFTFEREQGGIIRFAGDRHLVLKANHGFLFLFWGGDKATKFRYNPSNADGTRIQWAADKNKCWMETGSKEPVHLGNAPGCDYWCFIACDLGCHHIMDVHGHCLDASGGVGQALTVQPCDESEGQKFKASDTGITLCSDQTKCIHGGNIGGELVVHLADHYEGDPHNEEDGSENWLFFKDGTNNPSKDPTEPISEIE